MNHGEVWVTVTLPPWSSGVAGYRSASFTRTCWSVETPDPVGEQRSGVQFTEHWEPVPLACAEQEAHPNVTDNKKQI